MRSSNIHLFGEWFIGFEIWSESKGPYHLLPSIVWVSMEDLDINVQGSSVSFVFWNVVFQLHMKKWHRLIDDRKYSIEDDDMEYLLDELQKRHGWAVEPDPAKIRKMVEKTVWLRQIFANGGMQNNYAISLLSSMLRNQDGEKQGGHELDDLENSIN